MKRKLFSGLSRAGDQHPNKPSVIKWRRRYIVLLVSLLVIALLVALRLYLRLQPLEAEPAAPLVVETLRLSPQPFVQLLHASGTIEAEHRVVLSSQLATRIEALPWREGDSVVTGDQLVRLDASQQREEVARLTATMDRVKADLGFWRQQLKTDRGLLKDGGISRQQVDDTRRQVASLEASLRETQQSLNSAQTRLGYADVRAPFEGELQRIHVQPGEFVQPGAALLEIVATEQLKAVVSVAEVDVQKLRLQSHARIHVAATGQSWRGEVSRIYPALEQGSRTATLEILLPQHVGGVLPGMAASVDIELLRRDQALVVPSHSLHHRGSETGVFLLAEGVARWRVVQVGASQHGRVQIVSGLSSGDELITTPHPQLTDQRPVLAYNDWRSDRS